jgi:glycosyltransferase involved in cell wall biosynthesis
MKNRMGDAANATERSTNTSGIDISVIVPTRNEAPNVQPLLHRIAGMDFDGRLEVIFVDDSDDDTVAVITAARDAYDFDIGVIHRPKGQRQGGLGSAVVSGLARARGEFSCILDGDLQHPPELVADMYESAVAESMDLVVGSRYIQGGSAGGLSASREALSRIAGFAARAAFPRRCKGVSDPMSGFFLVRMSAIDLARVKGDGFKILLEIAATHPELHRTEVAYSFGERHAGETKASVVEGVRFLRSVAVLRAHPTRKTYYYDIHGVITVASTAWLPELEAFRMDDPIKPVDINVRVGYGAINGDDGVVYTEWLKRFGFALRIRRHADGTDLFVSRLVAMSPHVLYTNAVEPVLRWMFAERGYALVHAACVEKDGAAFFITAQTDTGKTTTMLKILDKSDFRFVSDDLTLINGEGQVLPYPKPLTISAHTLHAVKRNRLNRLQRMTMPIQSRLHSKTGRTVGFVLADTSLPAASMNAVVQKLIPPPKYHIEQLVPGVEIANDARVEWLFIIQRGGTGEVILEHEPAMDTLLENCEDAYGFPPYPSIEPYLRRNNGSGDLKRMERATITQAFDGVPALLLRSETLDWAVRIEEMINARVDELSTIDLVNGASVVDLRSKEVRPLDADQDGLEHSIDDDFEAETAIIG